MIFLLSSPWIKLNVFHQISGSSANKACKNYFLSLVCLGASFWNLTSDINTFLQMFLLLYGSMKSALYGQNLNRRYTAQAQWTACMFVWAPVPWVGHSVSYTRTEANSRTECLFMPSVYQCVGTQQGWVSLGKNNKHFVFYLPFVLVQHPSNSPLFHHQFCMFVEAVNIIYYPAWW